MAIVSGILGVVGALSPAIGRVLDKIPDPNLREKLKAEAEQEVLKTAASMDLAQVEVNKAEAQHSSIFVAGWRPFIGWVCGIGLMYAWLIQPLIAAIAVMYFPAFVLPGVDLEAIIGLVTALLGLGGMRTFEKYKGVNKRH